MAGTAEHALNVLPTRVATEVGIRSEMGLSINRDYGLCFFNEVFPGASPQQTLGKHGKVAISVQKPRTCTAGP